MRFRAVAKSQIYTVVLSSLNPKRRMTLKKIPCFMRKKNLFLINSFFFSPFSLEPQIQQSIQELGKLLSNVKGAGQVSLSQPSQRSNIQAESDMILRPLMDLLDGR